MLQTRSWSKLILMGGVLMALGVMGGGVRVARADGPLAQPAHINAGDLIVDLGMACGSEECQGNPSDRWDILTPGGAYKGTLGLNGKDSEGLGLAFEDSGRILLNDGYDVSRFGHSGGDGELVASPFGETSGYALAYALDVPENIYVAVEVASEVSIWRFPRDGAGYDSPDEVAVDPLDEPDGYHMSAIGLFGCTLYDICTQSQLADYPVAPTVRPRELRVLLDGSLISAEGGTVKRIKTDGTVEEYGETETGCLWSADAYNNVLYILDVCASRIDAFDLSTGNSIGLVKQYSTAEIAARGSYPVALRVYNHVAPPKPVIFVHGIQQEAFGAGFSTILGDSEIAPSVEHFIYYQDAAPEHCGQPMLLATDPPYPIPVMPSYDGVSLPGQFCDSESDFKQNVLLLHRDVQAAYEASGGQKVIVFGYSMGGPIIRGFLSYSMSLPGDQVAATMVDSVILVAGAMDGSAVSQCKSGGECPPGVNAAALITAQGLGFAEDDEINGSRPAIQELAPRSQWYEWANPVELPAIGYYEAHAEMREVRVQVRAGRSSVEKVIWYAGDGILAPGTSDPFDLPRLGGAKFSRPNTAEQWSWAFCAGNEGKELGELILDGSYTNLKIAAVKRITQSDCFHRNIPKKLEAPKLKVPDCRTQTPVELGEQLRQIIKGKLGKNGYSCPLHF
jgi:pimeloyl-ACP methyl ester carboxylesterase